MDEGVDGMAVREPVLECDRFRRGEEGRRRRALVDTPRLGELLLSLCRRSGSKTDDRTGEGGGKASSAGFRGVRTRLGEPDGLAGRIWGE